MSLEFAKRLRLALALEDADTDFVFSREDMLACALALEQVHVERQQEPSAQLAGNATSFEWACPCRGPDAYAFNDFDRDTCWSCGRSKFMSEGRAEARRQAIETKPEASQPTPEVKSFLARWTPTETNKICKCAGDDICLPHAAAHLVRTLAGLV